MAKWVLGVLFGIVLLIGLPSLQSSAQSTKQTFTFPGGTRFCNDTDVPVRAAFRRTKYSGLLFSTKHEEYVGWWVVGPKACISAPSIESCTTDWVGNRSNCVTSTVYYAEPNEGPVGFGALLGRWSGQEEGRDRICISGTQSFTFPTEDAGDASREACSRIGGISVLAARSGGSYNTLTSTKLTSDKPSLKQALGGTLYGPIWKIGPCDPTFENWSGHHDIGCICPAQTKAIGQIEGAYVYTEASSICTAAVHAGAVSLAGGQVRLQRVDNHGGSPSVTQNGVTSFPTRPFKLGFRFSGVTDEARNPIRTDACPVDSTGYSDSGVHSCYCYPDQYKYFRIWGSEVYANDSNICRAAVHAGALAPGEGIVTFTIVKGPNWYDGGVSNGVSSTSSTFGGSTGGFAFNARQGGAPVCPVTAEGLPASDQLRSCWCPPDRAASGGSVYGGKEGEYADISDFCRGAVHYGVVSPEVGGLVGYLITPGLSSYTGRDRAGVRVTEAGRRPISITYRGAVSELDPEMASKVAAATDIQAVRLGYVLAPIDGGPISKAPSQCPNFPDVLKGTSRPIICRCYSGKGDYPSVEGGADGVYSDGSRVCDAAFHAGEIGKDGGIVVVTPLPGREAYKGSRANGISSRNGDKSSLSFTVRAAGAYTIDPTASPPPPPAAPVATSTNGSATSTISAPTASPPKSMQGDIAALSACPSNSKSLTRSGAQLTCRCDAGWRRGTVWGGGAGYYTDDSSICQAARHAGLIGESGGVVRVTPAPGRSSYSGGVANGVTSQSYGAWGASFTLTKP